MEVTQEMSYLNCPACGHPEKDHDYGIPGRMREIPCARCPDGTCAWNLGGRQS